LLNKYINHLLGSQIASKYPYFSKPQILLIFGYTSDAAEPLGCFEEAKQAPHFQNLRSIACKLLPEMLQVVL